MIHFFHINIYLKLSKLPVYSNKTEINKKTLHPRKQAYILNYRNTPQRQQLQ